MKLIREVDLPETFRRRLLGGERAFPNEDSGGLQGYHRYAAFERTGKDPWDEDPDEIREWLGGWHSLLAIKTAEPEQLVTYSKPGF